jgi:hypothetical protein
MIVLRQPPYPLVVEYPMPEASTSYKVYIREKDRNVIEYESVLVSDITTSMLRIELPVEFSKYDESYSVEIYKNVGGVDEEDVSVEDNLTIERPYVDPNTLGTTATEIRDATKNERLARAIIDSIVDKGFYFYNYWIETTGQATDYISMWERVYKILKVYENSELAYDSSRTPPALGDWNYIITKDKTAITKDPTYLMEGFNRSESKPVGLMIANSDSISMFDTADSGNTLGLRPGVLFNPGADYIFHIEKGYKVVPYDIQDATKMLIDDIACGKLDYFKRYIVNYSTDQYKIQIDKSAFQGSGNMLVDKIIDKYITNVKKPGLL